MHECAWPDCAKQSRAPFCSSHMRRLPASIRADVHTGGRRAMGLAVKWAESEVEIKAAVERIKADQAAHARSLLDAQGVLW